MDDLKDLAEHILKTLEIYQEKQIMTMRLAIDKATEEVATGYDHRTDKLILILLENSPEESVQWAKKVLEGWPQDASSQ